MAVAPVFASAALNFGPPEMVAVMILGLSMIVVFSGKNIKVGPAMCLAGILPACVGVDVGSGVARFTFGEVNLLGGIPFVEVMIGLFAVGEVLNQLHMGTIEPIRARFRDLMLTRGDLKRAAPSAARGTVVGFLLGCLPGAATAAGSNANFIPTLTLGVPGGATTAVLPGAFLVYGVQTGPLLFVNEPKLAWGLLVSFLIGSFMLLALNRPPAPVFAQILRMKYGFMYPLIIVVALVGAFATSGTMFSVWIVLVFGLVGYVMKRIKLPTAPLVPGLVIGPLLEKALVQTSAMSLGNPMVFFGSPIAVSILAFTAALVAGPTVFRRVAVRRQAQKVQAPAGTLQG